MIELFFLSVGLAMDAFAVSVGLGSKEGRPGFWLAAKIALFFGGFQAFMPAIGFLAGEGLAEWIECVDHWVAFVLLWLIGGKMLYEAFQEGVEEGITQLTGRVLLTLSVATSIDAMAAGFTLPLLETPFLLSVVSIGAVTFALSFAGVFIGARAGVWLESKAEIVGGVVLMLIGLKILLEHTGWI